MISYLRKDIGVFLYFVGLFMFCISLLLPFNLRNISTILFASSILFQIFKVKSIKEFADTELIVNLLLFIAVLLSLSYSDNVSLGLKKIFMIMPLLISPLCFYMVSKKSIIIKKSLSILVYSLFFVSVIIFLIGVFIHNYIHGYLNSTIFIHYPHRMDIGYGKYSIHPIYMSLYVSIAMIVSIPIIKTIKNKMYLILMIIGVLFLSLILFLLARKGAIVMMIFIFVTYFFKKKRELKFNLLLAITFTVLIILAYNIDPIRNRFFELWNAIFSNTTLLGSTSIRFNIFNCAFENIKVKPFFGYGVGDVEVVLRDCYLDRNDIFKGDYYNSHNQYLSTWLASGILGIFSLIIMLVYSLSKAVRNKNFVSLAIIGLFIVIMLTENILERQDGILLFSFFINFFVFKHIDNKVGVS